MQGVNAPITHCGFRQHDLVVWEIVHPQKDNVHVRRAPNPPNRFLLALAVWHSYLERGHLVMQVVKAPRKHCGLV